MTHFLASQRCTYLSWSPLGTQIAWRDPNRLAGASERGARCTVPAHKPLLRADMDNQPRPAEAEASTATPTSRAAKLFRKPLLAATAVNRFKVGPPKEAVLVLQNIARHGMRRLSTAAPAQLTGPATAAQHASADSFRTMGGSFRGERERERERRLPKGSGVRPAPRGTGTPLSKDLPRFACAPRPHQTSTGSATRDQPNSGAMRPAPRGTLTPCSSTLPASKSCPSAAPRGALQSG